MWPSSLCCLTMKRRREEDVQFVDEHRAALIERVQVVMAVSDELLDLKMLHREAYAEIKAAAERSTMRAMRELYTALDSGGGAVKSAFYAALHQHQPHLLQSLREEMGAKRQRLRDWVKSEFGSVLDYNSLFGEEVLLSERYVELLIVQEHRTRVEREEEIWSTGERFQQIRSKKEPTCVEKFFCPDRGTAPRVVLLQGDSGHGKSFTAQKIMHDWASGSLYADLFDMVLLLRCKELNRLTHEERSFVELLNTSPEFQQLIQERLENASHKVLILIEGFDELRFSEKEISSPLPSDVLTPAPVQAIILSLFRGHLLSDASLLITARSSASDRLVSLVKRGPKRFTEILGFTQESVEKYFHQFFGDEQSFVKAFQCVQKNDVLLTSCFVPVICWTVCTILQERSEEGDDIMAGLQTTASIYVEFVSVMLRHHYRGNDQKGLTLLRGLGLLAESGMLGKQLLFDQQSVSKVETEPASNPFLSKILFKRRTNVEIFFSFMHLSFQEFFTAVYYALTYETEAQEKVTELLLKMERDLLQVHEPGEPFRRYYHLRPVVQFLFGIAGTDGEVVAMPPALLEELESWIKKVPQQGRVMPEDSSLFLLHCLCELHEEAFVRRAIEAWGRIKLSYTPLKRSDWWVLNYCLQCRPSISSLSVFECNLTDESLKLLLPALTDLPCQHIMLGVKSLVDSDIGSITATLGQNTALKSFRLAVDEVTDSDGKCLCLSLHVTKKNNHFRFWVEQRIPTEPVKRTEPALPTYPVLAGAGMVVSAGGNLRLDLAALTRPLALLCNLTEGSPGVDEPLNAVIGFLSSGTALQEAELILSCLPRVWAARIRPLIEVCPHISLIVRLVNKLQRFSHGLLLEAGITSLQELPKPPDCSVTVIGRRCNKPTDHCEIHDLERVCNRPVKLTFTDQNPPEQAPLQPMMF